MGGANNVSPGLHLKAWESGTPMSKDSETVCPVLLRASAG